MKLGIIAFSSGAIACAALMGLSSCADTAGLLPTELCGKSS